VSFPDVPITVSVVVPFGVPPVDEWPPLQPARARTPTIAAAIPRRIAKRSLRAKNHRNAQARSNGQVRDRTRGMFGLTDGGVTSDGLVVVTVAVALTGVTPSLGVSETGETVHVAAVGAPEQARATGWLKPLAGVTITLKVVPEPGVTAKVVGEAVTVKLGTVGVVPVPVSVTV
jgi:hypothetical protein